MVQRVLRFIQILVALRRVLLFSTYEALELLHECLLLHELVEQGLVEEVADVLEMEVRLILPCRLLLPMLALTFSNKLERSHEENSGRNIH